MARIYVAAPYELLQSAREVRERLIAAGFYVTSRWITDDEGVASTPENKKMWASRDLYDILSAQALLLINPPEWANQGTGGRHVEFGVALMAQLPVFIYGARTNVFHFSDGVAAASVTFDALLEKMNCYTFDR